MKNHDPSCFRWRGVALVPVLLVTSILLVPVPTVRAAGESPQVRAALEKAKTFLRKELEGSSGGFLSIGALGLIKAGEPANSPMVQKAVQIIYGKVGKSGYAARNNGIYEAGVDLMVLANHDAERHRVPMQAILDYLIKNQRSGGEWNYPHEDDGGDTSMVQYAMLGMWAAQRAGLTVPQATVERAARWLMKSQKPSGGFGYHPFSKSSAHPSNETPSMTMAGTAAMGICRLMLYPETNPAYQKKPKDTKRKFGVLEEVNVEATQQEQQTKTGKSSVPVGDMSRSMARGFGWLAQRWTTNTGRWQYYYLYTVERAAALSGVEQIGGHNWYLEGSATLLKQQSADGSWNGIAGSGKVGGTAFGILFLVRATGKALGAPDVGGGLLAGGRGLPDDLSELAMKGDEVVKEKKLGPLDELLKELSNTKDLEVAEVQKAILEKVEMSTPEDREALVKQKDLLLRLVDDPRSEVRRTVMWALGRTDDLKVARQLVRALKQENNVDVLIEVRNALCFLSRRPRGFGEPESPFHSLTEDADQAARNQALAEWRTEVLEKWGAWYRAVQPYEQRDELESIGI